MTYEHIFKPIQVGKLTLKNRIEIAPHEPKFASWDGLVTNEFITYTANMAKGGPALITVGDSPITQGYADTSPFAINLAHRYVANGLFKLADAIHRYEAAASVELNFRNEVPPAMMSKQEIKNIIKAFADGAAKCKNTGFDMVMIHAGNGWMISQFTSPIFNKRTDEYGCGTFENRLRFANEVLDAVRQAVGNDMAIEWRQTGDDLTPKGLPFEDYLQVVKALENKIDLLHILAGMSRIDPRVGRFMIQHPYVPLATNLHVAERYKKELNIPVVSNGSFSIELAEDAIASGRADMIGMIRHFIADPECIIKAEEGREDEVRPCIRCLACISREPHGNPMPIRCSVNPECGRELFMDEVPVTKKKVVVIGGGCAGMEAARRLSDRGASIVLFEKAPELGGSLIEAGANKLKGDVKRYTDWSVRMTKKAANVDIRTGTEATRELVIAEKPDAVIVAAGSEQIVPNIPGINSDNVCLAVDVDMGKATVGKSVVVIGAGQTGTETAVALAQDGHEVLLIDMLTLDEIDNRVLGSKSVQKTLRMMSDEAGVKSKTGVKAVEITKQGVIIDDKGAICLLPCDTIVLSVGVKPRDKILNEFAGTARKVRFIGDCSVKAGNITSAVKSAFYAAINV